MVALCLLVTVLISQESSCSLKESLMLNLLQASWFDTWKWLHYDEESDTAFCHTCIKAFKEKKLFSNSCDPLEGCNFKIQGS